MKKMMFPQSKKTIMIALVGLFILLNLTIASAITFDNEVIKADLTSFEWCFDNPWDADKIIRTTDFTVYQDNLGVDLIDAKLYVKAQSLQQVQVCDTVRVCENEMTQVYNNVTDKNDNVMVETCHYENDCREETHFVYDWFDVKQTDLLMKSADRFCYKGSRKAKLNEGNIDMNFVFDNGEENWDVVDFGRAWWNNSWGAKRLINIGSKSGITNNANHHLKIIFNSSNIDYGKTNSDGSDIRFLDSTETVELPYFISVWNESGQSIAYVNTTIGNVSNTSVYVYYDNSGATTTRNFNNTFGDNIQLFYEYTTNPNDLSDNGNDGNNNGCEINPSANFTEVDTGFYDCETSDNDYILSDSRLAESNTGSLEFWINSESHSSQLAVISQPVADGASGCQIQLATNGKIQVACGSGGTFLFCDSVSTVGDGEWLHSVFTWDGTDYRVYFNGSLDNTCADTDNMWQGGSSTPFTVANNYYSATPHAGYDGVIDNIMVYDGTVLNADQVSLKYSQPVYSVGSEELSTNPTSFSDVTFEAYNTTSDTVYAGGEAAFNTSLLQDIEKMRVNFTVSDDDVIDTVKIFFVANGTNSCSLGNRQSEVCVQPPSYVQWQNNTVTQYFNASLGTVGDNIDCSVTGSNTSQTWSCLIDEHYQNVWKNYPLNFGSVLWDEDASRRIQDGNWWKISINSSIVPVDADIYKLDFRVSDDNSSLPPDQPIELYLCNSSYTTGNPTGLPECALVAAKSPGDLQDDGTKFRDVIPQSFVSGLGDIGFALIGSNTIDSPNRYYTMKTYDIPNGGSSVAQTSSDDAASFTPLSTGFETDFNVNWFYNGTGNNVTGFQVIVSANDTVNGTFTNSSVDGMVWSLGLLPPTPPEVLVDSPSSGDVLNLSMNVSWTVIDVNGDRFVSNVTLSNSTNSTVIGDTLIDSNTSFVFDSSYWGFGIYNLSVLACENETTELFCDQQDVNLSLGNTPPALSFTDASPVLIGSVPYNVTWSCSDPDLQATTNHVFLNGSLNFSSAQEWFNLNISEGDGNVTVFCDDGVLNVSDTLIVQYREACVVNYSGISSGERYDTLDLTVLLGCQNTNPDSCNYSINGYADQTVANCSDSFNLSLHRGWNRIVFTVSTGGVVTDENVKVWARDETNDDVFSYPVLWLTLLAYVGLLVLSVVTGVGLLALVAAVVAVVIGFEFTAFSNLLGLLMGLMLIIAAIIVALIRKE